MPVDVFDVCLALVVKIRITSVDLSDKIAADLSDDYCRNYRSEDFDHLKSEWIEAASQVLDGINKLEIDNTSARNYCDHREHFIKNFHRNGEKKGFFEKRGGTLFHKGTYDPQRVKKAADSFISFCVLYKNGLAKPEWTS